jgi:hypothetical protein
MRPLFAKIVAQFDFSYGGFVAAHSETSAKEASRLVGSQPPVTV